MEAQGNRINIKMKLLISVLLVENKTQMMNLVLLAPFESLAKKQLAF